MASKKKQKTVYILVSVDEGDVNAIETYSTPALCLAATNGDNKSPLPNPVDEDGQPIESWDGKEQIDIWAEGYSEKHYTLYPSVVDEEDD